MAEGIEERHSKGCPASTAKARAAGAKCASWCTVTHQAQAYNRHTKKQEKRTFPTVRDAKRWRNQMQGAIEKGQVRTANRKTVRQACEELVAGMHGGTIHSNNGKPYSDQSNVNYEVSMRLRIIPQLGAYRLADLDRPTVQLFIDKLVADGDGASTVRSTLKPLQVIYRRALRRGELHIPDPTKNIELPRRPGPRDRVANELEAQQLIAAAPEIDQPIWALALYSGMRLGEMQGLTWDRIDTSRTTPFIVVNRAWHTPAHEFGDVKTDAGRNRRVPVLDVLKPYMEIQYDKSGGEGFVFPHAHHITIGTNYPPDPEFVAVVEEIGLTRAAERFGVAIGTIDSRRRRIARGARAKTADSGDRPFSHQSVRLRAHKAWSKAGLNVIGYHECRHTFASMLFARRVNPVQIQHWMGHANLQETLNTYTHLIPGGEDDAISVANTQIAVETIEQIPHEIEVASHDDDD